MKLLVLAAVLVAGAAGAEESHRVERAAQYGGQGWSVLGGQTVGAGANVLTAQLGFPGISLGFLHGVTPGADVGFKLGFNYGYEGLVTVLVPGVRGEAQARFTLLDTGKLSVGLNVGVGVFGYFGTFYSVAGMSIPVGIAVGIPVASSLSASVTLDTPMFVTFGTFGGLTFPLLLGGGLEYFVDRNFAVTFGVKMGPALNPTGFRNGVRADFDFQAHLGIAYKL